DSVDAWFHGLEGAWKVECSPRAVFFFSSPRGEHGPRTRPDQAEDRVGTKCRTEDRTEDRTEMGNMESRERKMEEED
ncbi:hypothetical protein Tco_0057521, partial [Tanacetum coccineum]